VRMCSSAEVRGPGTRNEGNSQLPIPNDQRGECSGVQVVQWSSAWTENQELRIGNHELGTWTRSGEARNETGSYHSRKWRPARRIGDV
jgi:hypothetical protein